MFMGNNKPSQRFRLQRNDERNRTVWMLSVAILFVFCALINRCVFSKRVVRQFVYIYIHHTFSASRDSLSTDISNECMNFQLLNPKERFFFFLTCEYSTSKLVSKFAHEISHQEVVIVLMIMRIALMLLMLLNHMIYIKLYHYLLCNFLHCIVYVVYKHLL